MTIVAKLGYLGLEVSDIAAWRRFAETVLGLAAEPRADGALALRMDGQAHRFLLREGSADDVSFVGWELADKAALDAAAARLAVAGIAAEPGTADEAEARGVARLLRFRDPDGLPSELFVGPRAGAPFRSSRLAGGFVTGDQGMGHVLVAVADAARAEKFYREILDFRLSDYVDVEFDGFPLHAVFLHANPRHHSFAFAAMPAPKRLHHFMLEVEAIDDVGAAFDRAQDEGVPIARTIGRHENDRMISFYGVTPSGFAFEVGWGARRIDDATWETRTYHRISEWGHRPPLLSPRGEEGARGAAAGRGGGSIRR
jgi:2,3-dihydroxybiphenyl 1,2-dioxygenase